MEQMERSRGKKATNGRAASAASYKFARWQVKKIWNFTRLLQNEEARKTYTRSKIRHHGPISMYFLQDFYNAFYFYFALTIFHHIVSVTFGLNPSQPFLGKLPISEPHTTLDSWFITQFNFQLILVLINTDFIMNGEK